ncbi:MAG TPA: HD domain-containing protein [Desulfotomaculum sp.]|nr:HD domain-containing protein [Desulfotomaculum sp.]
MYHDTGKIGIPDAVLFKPGPLNHEEWHTMHQHPIAGAELIQNGNGGMGLNGNLAAVVSAVRHHHEKWNGSGSPDGLSGPDIPLAARIIAIADAFDAMMTDRPYRKALPYEDALEEILRCAGTHFDPEIAVYAAKVCWKQKYKQEIIFPRRIHPGGDMYAVYCL